jgi:hypothetical protein
MAARITIGVVLSAFALSLLLSLTGCDSDSAVAVVADGTGTDSLDSEVIVTTDAVGSVGDGPIVNARVRVFSNTDRLLMETRSSNTADYQLSIKTAGHNYPLTIIADQGTDLVTNAPPDFRLVSTIMKPGNRQVANLNPYSTLIVESAKRAGGINDATIAAATEAVVQRYGFGLDPGLGIDPMFDPMDDSNVHVIVKASETLGEMIRRTRDAVITSGTLVTGDGVVEALAADLIDGWIDGEGARGHDPRIAAVANVASAAVMVEAMANRLHVYKVNATQAMDDAIEHVRPNAKGRTRDVGIPADALVQSKRALRAAGRVVGDERVSQTIAVMDGTEPGTTEIFGLPTGIEYVLNDAILTAAYVYDDFTLDGINTVAKDGSSLDSDPNSGDHSEPTDEADSDNNYSVSASAGAGGSISPASQTVTHGNSTSFSVSPNSGYSIASVSGCGGSLSGSTYTTGPITQACAVSASFSANQYSVSASAGSGGSISPSSQTVTHGASTSFSVSPSSGYSIASVSGCGGSLSGSTYTTGPITQACSVSASFSANQHSVSASAGSGGSISPASQTVTHGNSTSFSVSPNSGYSIASVSGCGGSLSGSTYTTGPITQACAVSASFSANQYSVSASAGSGGSISPSSQTVTHGASTSFSVSPNSGYSIASVSGCGGSLSGSTYTTGPITQACAVSASFSANQYSVSASAGSGGSISPSSQTVTHGASTSFSVSPSSGYSIASVTGCGGSLSGSSYTTGPITQACAVSASFDPEPLQEEPNTVLWSLNEWNWFDGVNEQRTTGLTLSQLAGGSFTIEAIVQYAGTASRTWTPIIGASHGPSYLHSESFFIGKNSGSNALRVDIGGFGYINIDSRGLFDGQEHHLALVYDRQAQQIRIYVDQSLIHTQTGVSGTLSTSSQMLIGAVGHTTAERWLGWIGPTRLTGGALSPTQFLGTEGSEPIAPRPNRTPTIAGTPTTNLVVGNFWSFTPTAADPDGDSLTFTIQGEPAWASFDPSTGQISGTPSAAGSFGPITITVSDGKQSVSLAAFTLQVVEHATGTASLSWTIPTERADGTFLDDLAGYRLYYGKDANSLTHVIQIADVGRTNQLIENLDNGTWYFAVTAYCRKGLESAKSNIGSKTIR